MAGLHDGHRRRMVEKALNNGIDTLEEHEILEILLFNTIPRGNTNETAHALLDRFGSLYNVCTADAKELKSVDGIGTKSADFLNLMPMFAKAYELSLYGNNPRFDSGDNIGKYCVSLFRGAEVEKLYMILLDKHKRVKRRIKLKEGRFTNVDVDYKEIVKSAVNADAAYVVVTHNHPNGSSTPSQNDIDVTAMIRNCLVPLDVYLLDHILVANGEFYSIREHGTLIL